MFVKFEAQEDNHFRALKVLAYIGLQSEGSADFQDILDNLDIQKSTLWRYISSLREQGLIDISRSYHTCVFFKKRSVWEQLRDPLLAIVTALDIGLKKINGEYFIDSGMIRRYRDRTKNLKPIKKKESRNPKFEKIVVETIREAEQLNKEFKELGINKRASVLSTHNTMRYSRVIG
ncbi:hypothetical protein [Methanococcoides burtonii]|uniref:Uncharacterized protein n=1 Tax=Methanococcoides burtonii (strain DSM 6242 / NBRC 107633 / OCM 468 / ACE-M) TaxID=259564 RepID=Q12WU2_METBU|nr:hypothetical protein [Methanococcoides burtonii]ABE52084.1 Hypothetical protein Mbur_1161 [Methanococcoides burtonii DSM 6242]